MILLSCEVHLVPTELPPRPQRWASRPRRTDRRARRRTLVPERAESHRYDMQGAPLLLAVLMMSPHGWRPASESERVILAQ
jgi:hypothetical protein